MCRPSLCFCILLSEVTPLQGSPLGPPNDTLSHPCLNTLLGTQLPLPCHQQAYGSHQPCSTALGSSPSVLPTPSPLTRVPPSSEARSPPRGAPGVRAASGCSPNRLSYHTGNRTTSLPHRTGTRAYRAMPLPSGSLSRLYKESVVNCTTAASGQLKDKPT